MNKRRFTILACTALLIVTVSWLSAFFRAEQQGLLAEEIEKANGRLHANTLSTTETITLFQNKISQNPSDAVSYTILGQLYLRQARETGDVAAYERAETAVRQALTLLPHYDLAQTTLAATLFAQHRFDEALPIANDLYQRDPENSLALLTLGDAYLSLGQYDEAAAAYEQLLLTPPALARLAHQSELHGQPALALQQMEQAAQKAWQNGQSGEEMAWYLFRLGDLYFHTGQINEAESYYNAALQLHENYYLALAALGKVQAARGHYDEAIRYYKRATAVIPQPDFLAALGDLYTITDQPQKAQEQYETVVFIGRLAAINQQVYNRQLANFYADHNWQVEEALQLATAELEARRDIYGYDSAAWAYYKNGLLDKAQAMMDEAMKLGTRDARLFYHAGMIAQARGNVDKAVDLLNEALTINPHFDLLQATIAQETLANLTR